MKQLIRFILRSLSLFGITRPQNLSGQFNPQNVRHSDLVELIQQLNIPKSGKVLDMGCGTAQILSLLAQAGYTDLYGCDWLPKEKVASLPAKCHYEQFNLNLQAPLPFADQSFDLVISSDVLEHLENPSFALREISRLMKNNAAAVVTLPNAFNIFERLYILLTGNSTRYKTELPEEYGHISLFPLAVLRSLLNRVKLQITKIAGGRALISGWFLFPEKKFSPLLSFYVMYVLKKV